MDNLGPEFQEKLKKLSEDYRTKLPERLEKIKEAWRQCSPDNFSDLNYKKLEKLIHHLAGSGSTFGFPEISKTAKEIESLLSALNYENFVEHRKQLGLAFQHLEQIVKKG